MLYERTIAARLLRKDPSVSGADAKSKTKPCSDWDIDPPDNVLKCSKRGYHEDNKLALRAKNPRHYLIELVDLRRKKNPSTKAIEYMILKLFSKNSIWNLIYILFNDMADDLAALDGEEDEHDKDCQPQRDEEQEGGGRDSQALPSSESDSSYYSSDASGSSNDHQGGTTN